MKHGVAFRKLSRDTAHRMLMLRNMASEVIEHEQIQTTVAKAKEAARIVEKARRLYKYGHKLILEQIITLGKKGTPNHRSNAQGILITAKLLPKVFDELATRYAGRQGGYTRISKLGRREGDNAPRAVLELVDGPKDTRFEMTARKIGWELMGWKAKSELQGRASLWAGLEGGVKSVEITGKEKWLKPTTAQDIEQVLQFRDKSARQVLGKKAATYMNILLAEPAAQERVRKQILEKTSDLETDLEKTDERNDFAVRDAKANLAKHQQDSNLALRQIWSDKAPGRRTPWSTQSSLGLSKGALGRRPWQTPQISETQ